MYWDVVEVKAEPNYSLFVRFADGTEGHVQLSSNDFTGVLMPLREKEFFNKVFIEHGAVTWPGEIDLAPDAIYEQIRQGSPTRAA